LLQGWLLEGSRKADYAIRFAIHSLTVRVPTLIVWIAVSGGLSPQPDQKLITPVSRGDNSPFVRKKKAL